MAYDKDFYDKYREYLKEGSVRTSHDLVFRQFRRLTLGRHLRTIDLGCGLGEYWQYNSTLSPSRYLGVDINDFPRDFNYVCGDYHNLEGLRLSLGSGFRPETFVSLFSIENFHPAREKYAFYRKIFETFPSIRFGLSSGFFYESKRNQETVVENGRIVSYQTIEDPAMYISDVFSEFRLHIHTPSEMFGPDVVEIWKIFIRR